MATLFDEEKSFIILPSLLEARHSFCCYDLRTEQDCFKTIEKETPSVFR